MSGGFRRWIAPAALAVALLSLAANGFLLWRLRHPGEWAAPAVAALARERLGPEGTFRYTVRVPPGTPLRLDIPIDERFEIAVDTVIPVSTLVRVPIRGPFGTFNAEVPVRADVPLRTRLPLRIRHTFRLRTQTSEAIAVPVEIRLGEILDGLAR